MRIESLTHLLKNLVAGQRNVIQKKEQQKLQMHAKNLSRDVKQYLNSNNEITDIRIA